MKRRSAKKRSGATGIPDVPTSALSRRRSGELPPEVARLRHILPLEIDPVASCQVCNTPDHLIVFEARVDPIQRITIAVCRPCVDRARAWFDLPPPKPTRPQLTVRRAARGRG